MNELALTLRGACAFLVLALALLLPAGVAHATAYRSLDLDQRLELAVDVFVGRVTAVEGERRGDEPWTVVSFSVDAWLLRDGTVNETGPFEVSLAFLGGSATGVAARQVAGFPTFTVGERALLATYGDEVESASPLVGVTQGLWRELDGVWRDEAGEAMAVDASGRPTLAAEGAPEDDWFASLLERLRELRDTQ